MNKTEIKIHPREDVDSASFPHRNADRIQGENLRRKTSRKLGITLNKTQLEALEAGFQPQKDSVPTDVHSEREMVNVRRKRHG